MARSSLLRPDNKLFLPGHNYNDDGSDHDHDHEEEEKEGEDEDKDDDDDDNSPCVYFVWFLLRII